MNKPKRIFSDIQIHEISLVSAPANPDAKVLLFKSKGVPHKEITLPEKTTPTPEETKPAEVAKAAEPVKTETTEEMKKSLRAEIEKELQTKLDKASAETAKLQKTLRVRDKLDFVKTVLKAIPGEADTLADHLVTLEDASPEVAKSLEATLKACSELIAKSELLKQKSSGLPAAGSLDERVETLVKAKRASNSQLTAAAAEAAVWTENPQLYSEYLRK